jgi:hypothetical protein
VKKERTGEAGGSVKSSVEEEDEEGEEGDESQKEDKEGTLSGNEELDNKYEALDDVKSLN